MVPSIINCKALQFQQFDEFNDFFLILKVNGETGYLELNVAMIILENYCRMTSIYDWGMTPLQQAIHTGASPIFCFTEN